MKNLNSAPRDEEQVPEESVAGGNGGSTRSVAGSAMPERTPSDEFVITSHGVISRKQALDWDHQ